MVLNVSSFNGSLNYDSETKHEIGQVVDLIKEIFCDKEIFYLDINDYVGEISMCKGDESVFDTPLIEDYKENIIFAEEIIKDTNIFILGSPIYSGMISGYAKTFIDRISPLFHLLPCKGALAISILCCHSNGYEKSKDYLEDIVQFLGMYNLKTIIVNRTFGKYYCENQFIDLKMNLIKLKIDKRISLPKEMEDKFKAYKKIYETMDEESKEKKIWNNFGYSDLDCYSGIFNDYLKKGLIE